MNEMTLNTDVMEDLMQHYGAKTKEEIVNKALSMLRIIAYVDSNEGQVVARKGNQEANLSMI